MKITRILLASVALLTMSVVPSLSHPVDEYLKIAPAMTSGDYPPVYTAPQIDGHPPFPEPTPDPVKDPEKGPIGDWAPGFDPNIEGVIGDWAPGFDPTVPDLSYSSEECDF